MGTFVLYLLYCYLITCLTRGINGHRYDRTRYQRYSQYYSVISHVSTVTCTAACAVDKRCILVSYQKGVNSCALSDKPPKADDGSIQQTFLDDASWDVYIDSRDDCQNTACANGGTCNDGIGQIECHCPPGWTGRTCQINIDECASTPCLNGAACIDKINKFSCQCAPDWNGMICQHRIDDCAGNPCENGGTCIDGILQYTCICADKWEGSRCENCAKFNFFGFCI